MAVKKKAAKEPAKKETFSVYLGPSIRGVITKGQIFPMAKAEVLAAVAQAAEKYPRIADLIVEGEALPEAAARIKQPDSLLHKTYENLAKGQR